MAFQTSDLTNNPVLINGIIAEVEKASAFQTLATKVPLDGSGSIIPLLGQAYASIVGEGAIKPVIDAPLTELTLEAKKFARTVLWTDEAADLRPIIKNAIMNEAVGSIARTFDAAVGGFYPGTLPTGFDTLSGATPVAITSYSTAVAAFKARNGKAATGVALNLELLDELRGVVTVNDVPALQINGDDKTGTINGKRYVVFEGGDGPLGYVGAFNRAVWGVIPGSVKVIPLEETAEVDGETIALKQRNMGGAVVEGRFGFRVYDLTDFAKIVSGISGS